MNIIDVEPTLIGWLEGSLCPLHGTALILSQFHTDQVKYRIEEIFFYS